MARDPYIEQRLINWGRWKAGDKSGGLGFAATNWQAFNDSDRYSTSAPVLPDGEESVTEAAVQSTAEDLRAALAMQYVEGGSIESKAARIGCHEQTYRGRVNAGQRAVSAWLADRDQASRKERERVESMQRVASASLAERERAVRLERARVDAILKKPAGRD